MSARVRVKVDALGRHRDRGVSGGKGLRLGLKTGEKRRISGHKIVQFLHCTKLPAQAMAKGGDYTFSKGRHQS